MKPLRQSSVRALRQSSVRALRHSSVRALRHSSVRALRHSSVRALRQSLVRAFFFCILVLLSSVSFAQRNNIHLIRGTTSYPSWSITGDYTSYDSIIFKVNLGSNQYLQKAVTKSYTSPTTTLRCTLYVNDTQDLNPGDYYFNIYAFGIDTLVLASGYMKLTKNVALHPIPMTFPRYTIVPIDTPNYVNTFIVGQDSNNIWQRKSVSQTRTILGIDTLGANLEPYLVVTPAQSKIVMDVDSVNIRKNLRVDLRGTFGKPGNTVLRLVVNGTTIMQNSLTVSGLAKLDKVSNEIYIGDYLGSSSGAQMALDLDEGNIFIYSSNLILAGNVKGNQDTLKLTGNVLLNGNPLVTGGSVGNADSLGGQPAANYTLKSQINNWSTGWFTNPSLLKLGKTGRQIYFNNGAYSDFWLLNYVIHPYNLPYANQIMHEFRTDYYNDTLKTFQQISNLTYLDTTGAAIWHSGGFNYISNYNTLNVGDLPDSTTAVFNGGGIVGVQFQLQETNKTVGAKRFPMPVKGFEFKFGSTPYYTYPYVYSFYSDLTIYTPKLETAYHFYGKGNYPSYFGGDLQMPVGDLITGADTLTQTEIGYLDGVTSSVQTQINSKITSSAMDNLAEFDTQIGITGTPSASTYWRGDNSWAAVEGGGGGTWGSITGTLSNQIDLQNALNAKQNTLISGTNIKTINNTSLLGSGNIDVSGLLSTRGWRYAEDYGAVGDGVTNDFIALRKCFMSGVWGNPEPQKDSLFIQLKPGAVYYVNDSFDWRNTMGTKYLHIEGNGATIKTDTVNLVNGYLFNLNGIYGGFTTGWSAIPINYNRGDIRIKVPVSVWSGAKRGDIIWITTHPGLGGTHEAPDWVSHSVSKGELAEVDRVYSDTTISIPTPLEESYITSTAVIKRFFFPTVIIRNLNLTSVAKHCTLSTKRAIDINAVKNSLFENISVEGFEHTAIIVSNSINLTFKGIKIRDISLCANYGANYGIVTSGCQNVLYDGNNILGGRHAIDIASSYYLPGRKHIVVNNFLSADLRLSTSSLGTHPGVRDILVANNVVHGIIGMRSTHNTIIGNQVFCQYNDGQGTGMAAINIGNAWNPTGGWNLIANNYIEGKFGGIDLYSGNVNGMLGHFTVVNNVGVSSHMVAISSYYEGNVAQNINDVIIRGNDWTVNEYGNTRCAVIVGYGVNDTLVINNFVFEDNNIRNGYGILVYSPSTRIDIKKFLIRKNTFNTLAVLELTGGARIGFLDISNNVIHKTGAVFLRPVWIRSGNTIGTFKHFDNTYMDFGNMSGEAFVQNLGTITNWYRGNDIIINASGYPSIYSGTATNIYNNNWVQQ